MGRKEKILVVDDEEIVRIQIQRVLAGEGYEVLTARSGAEALGIMKGNSIDLLLSDMMMEGMDGLALLKEVNERFPGTIFIILTGHGSLATAIESMRLGAFDYLLKPCENEELMLRIRRGLSQRRLQKKVEDQTRRLEHMAITDGLTGLYSRSYFMEALEREFKNYLRYRSPVSFMMVDIDFFKEVNDRYGHLTGDEVLRRISVRFRKIVRETDIIGRYGGEEFGIILPRTDLQGAQISARRIRVTIEEDLALFQPPNEDPKRITVSIGIASCPVHRIRTTSQFIKAADLALYKAKRGGRNRVEVYRPGDETAIQM